MESPDIRIDVLRKDILTGSDIIPEVMPWALYEIFPEEIFPDIALMEGAVTMRACCFEGTVFSLQVDYNNSNSVDLGNLHLPRHNFAPCSYTY